MFKFFQKLFNKKGHPKNNYLCSINFEMNRDGTVNIICYWPEFTDKNSQEIEYVSKEYSLLIHLLTSGFFNDEIVKTLNSLTHKDNELDYCFVGGVFSNWSKIIDFKANNMEPAIKPSLVFKNGQLK